MPVRFLHWPQFVLAVIFTIVTFPALAQQVPAPLAEEPMDLSPLLASPADDVDELIESDEGLQSAPDELEQSNDIGDEEATLEENTAEEEEVIRERFSNRRVKIERTVKQDEYGNYINHGPWKQWDEKGNLVAQGQFVEGEREGVWHRWHRRDQSRLLSQVPFNQFRGPFISQARFSKGEVDGNWIIFDSRQAKITDWAFKDGQRQGISSWWYANGRKMREINYTDGETDGFAREWAPDGSVTADDKYVKGHKIAKKTTYHAGSKKSAAQKKAEGTYLFAKIVMKEQDDWWNGKPAVFTREGDDVKHGLWTSWYTNGQEHIKGKYRNDLEIGKFTWWYSNGQKALEGSYRDGKPHGRWTWWHENGQKATHGAYTNGQLAGRWIGWTPDGKLARQEDHTNSGGTVLSPAARAASRPINPKR